ncbi:MAG: tetrahydromethanopterin S-methyltransferase subunit B [Methanosarcinaceae archaeon]|jgi:tetrahydromethanopterin S-methyltransferase subunit B|nr:tetrahydromethanopterin S-methyltransferase subunit B [Methanosarcinaceae archaeon]NKQ38676.1 tetrahydromethanopterin S-methyltransferase subunit B [Methanosarcinales archaeon]
MNYIRVEPDINLIIDPTTSLLAKERDDMIEYSMDSIMEKIDELDEITEDIVNSLAPEKPLLNSYKGREKTSYIAGLYANAFYGIVAGLLIAGLLALILSFILANRGGI